MISVLGHHLAVFLCTATSAITAEMTGMAYRNV
jgi:hypothetical protein